MSDQEQRLTLPDFINRQNIMVKSFEFIDSTNSRFPFAWKIVLERLDGGRWRQMTVPHWGHGGGLDRLNPANELPSIMASLISDASVYESCGDDEQEYMNEFGEDDIKEVRRVLRGCKASRNRLVKWLGDDLYQELLYDVEGY